MAWVSKKLGIALATVALGAAAAATLWWNSGTGEHPLNVQSLFQTQPSSVDVGDPAAFAWVDCKPRLFDGSPAVAVTFTQALGRSQDWDKLIKVSESASDNGAATPITNRWVLGDNPRVLWLPNVKPEHQYRIQMDASIAAAANSTLGAAQDCTVKSEAMPTSFYFASRGMVLPAGQNGGLPVVTVNMPEVDVQFLRVQEASLSDFLEQVGGRPHRTPHQQASEGDGEGEESGWIDPESKLKGTVSSYTLDNLREKATSVYLSRFTTDTRPNRRNVSFLPVEQIKELQEPGIYVAVMTPPGRFGWDHQVTYFYVTDIGLHMRRHAQQTDVFATSLKTGEGLKGIEISLIDTNGKALAQAATDGDGHAVLTGDVQKGRVLLARRGKELSLLALRDPALDLSEYDINGHPSRNQKLFVYAGRDLYRPGEQFTASVLARDADGKPLPAPLLGLGQALPLTLTLKKPDGEVVSTQLVRPHSQGKAYYQQAIDLPASAPTGRWLLEARVDPAARQPDASWGFQVEEFLPERMKMEFKSDAKILTGAASWGIHVTGNYLYGAPAAGNALQITQSSERQRIALPQQWPGFVFGDFADDTARQRRDLEEQTLDEQGQADVNVSVDLQERRSPMKLRASFSLLESGGRPVVRSLERTWWPADVLVGVRPLFERDVTQEGQLAGFELIRVNAQGQAVPAKGLMLRLIREERSWYWRYDDSRGWHGGYHEEDEPLESRTIALTDKRLAVSLPVTYGRYRIEVYDPDTKHTMRYRFYAGWGAQDAEAMGNRPDRVGMKLEGAPYRAGDKAKLTMTSPHEGEALITVEGDRVLYQKRAKVRAGDSTVEIPIDSSWNRHDLYITAAVFRPGSAGDRITPARALGLVHLPLARTDRQIKVALEAPAKAVPERQVPVKIKLTDAQGQAIKGGSATVTLSAVDVGILNITRYATPQPTDFFFGKHRYGADVLDLYGKLIEKMEGNVARHRFGGDAGKRDTQSMPRKVRLVDIFSGPVPVNDKGEATVMLDLPDFNGTLRLMAVAHTDEQFGHSDAEMTVAAPLVAELAMPRFIAPGDKATIALDVTNLSGNPQEVKVAIEADAPLRISGQNEAVKLANNQRRVLYYSAEATDAWGLAPIRLTVTAGSGANAIKIVRQAALQVQPITPTVRDVRRVRLEPGATHTLATNALDSYWAGSASVGVTVSNKPPIDVRNAVQGLLMYPYGCLEQTTSSAYPLVFIDEAGAQAFGMKGLSREERARRLDSAFGRLSGMQQAQGGFGLWAASNPYEGWLSAYVTGFLQDAHEAGFAVPPTMLEKATHSLLEQLQKAPSYQIKPPKEIKRDAQGRITYRDADVLRNAHLRLAEAAHAGYILARAQKAPLATLRTLHDDHRGNARSPLALVHLSLALKLMGDEKRAQVALNEALELGYGINPQQGAGYWDEWLGDYGSKLRDLALSYALLHRHQIAHPRRETLLMDLADSLGTRSYHSTQERLALFLAARAAGGSSTGNQPWQANLDTGTGADAKTDKLDHTATVIRYLDAPTLKKGASLTNTGSNPLFLEVSAEGYPIQPLPPQDDRIVLERTWWSADGQALTARQFKTGDTVIVRVKVNARQRIKDALIVERVPAGMEVENLNLSQGMKAEEFTIENVNVGEAMADKRIKHREFRDDRFVAAADLRDGVLNLFYLLRVVTPGQYVVPAPFAEDMYRPDIRGVGKAEAPITVVNPRAK